jgi:hypothetical protein
MITIQAEDEDVVLYDFSRNRETVRIPVFRFNDTVRFGQITGNAYCKFSILPGFENLQFMNLGTSYFFRFYSQRELIGTFRQFRVENDRGSSILTTSFQYTNPQKAANFLNSLTHPVHR